MKTSHMTIEGKKREVNRREASEAYRKNRIYTLSTKKPIQILLEEFLSGDEEINVSDANHVNSFSEITSPENIENHLIDEEHIETLEEVRDAALTTENPTIQDLRIAIEASNQLLYLNSNISEEEKEKWKIKLELLERLKNQTFLPKEIIFNQNKEKEIYNRKFQKAIIKYKFQMKMAENNFQLEMPIYSLTA